MIYICNHQESERQSTEWEKIFANHVSNMQLVAGIGKKIDSFEIQCWRRVIETLNLQKDKQVGPEAN